MLLAQGDPLLGRRVDVPTAQVELGEGLAALALADADGLEHAHEVGEGVEGLQAMRGDAAASVEADAVDLALKIAEQAIGAALAADPELVLEVVRGALRRLVERDRVVILVNPEDFDLVRDHATRLVGELGGIEHCEVQAERRVRAGGAIVRTSEGEVDATLDTKLARAREVLEHELANEGAEPGDVAEARQAPRSGS